MSRTPPPAQPDDTNLYQDEHVLLPGSSASVVSLDEINALAAQQDQATRALEDAETIAATPVRVVRRVVRRPSTGLEL